VIFVGVLALALTGARAEDSDDTKAAIRAWQLAQKPGPLAHDPYILVPLDIPSERLAQAKTNLEALLQPPALDSGQEKHVRILDDERYVLYGDLFKTGEIYALVELPADYYGGQLAFAQLVKGRWELRGLWNIDTVWKSKEKKDTGDEHYPVPPAEAPFELVDFDGVHGVIMAGEVWRYYQSFYLLRFDPKTRSLQLLADAMGKPEFHDGLWRLYFNSGHRSVFEEWVFAKYVDGKLKKTASWHDGSPDRPGELPAHPFIRAVVDSLVASIGIAYAIVSRPFIRVDRFRIGSGTHEAGASKTMALPGWSLVMRGPKTRLSMLDAGCWILDSGFWILDSG